MRALAHLDRNWILVAILTIFAVAPLTYPGFFQAHSGYLTAFNVEHLSDAPNWGRTPDALRGEGKLPYLLAWPFFKLSASGVVAIKWGYGLAFLLAALGAYAWTRRWLGRRGAVLAAVVYTYLPWHLGTVYVRGAYAEAWLWAFWPFILWAVDRQRQRQPLAAAIVGLPALAAAWWTQAGLAAILMLGLFLSIILRARTLSIGEWAAALLIIAVVVIAVLILPSAEARIPFVEQFLHPYQLVSAEWGNGLSFQIGLAAVGLSGIAVALRVARGWGRSQDPDAGTKADSPSPVPDIALRRVSWFLGVTALLLVTLTLSPLAFIWDVVGLKSLLTYPWQLLALIGLPLAFLAGSVARLDAQLAKFPVWAGLIALVLLASYPYLAPRFTQVDPGSEPVAMFQPAGADAPQMMLLDTNIAPPNEITPTLAVTLTWQAVASVADDYTVFVHVLTPDEKVTQQDTRPCGGECPTRSWQPGEIVVDRHRLDLPAGAPPGPYRLAVGLYLLDTGERVAVIGRDDGTVFLHVP